MIRLDNVEKVYRTDRIETVALSGVNLDIEEGEFVSIMGPSGCGKSTLMHLIGLLDAPSKGTISLAGAAVTDASDKALARMRNESIGFVFQSFHLIPDLSVLDNVEIPLLYRRVGATERKKAAEAALERVGLSARKHHFPSQLSGGQQQRVAIARASAMGDEIISILQDLNTQEKTTLVMVTHDPRQAEKTERTIRMFDGRRVN
jgi:putative ABC transport system ATP-binding protein